MNSSKYFQQTGWTILRAFTEAIPVIYSQEQPCLLSANIPHPPLHTPSDNSITFRRGSIIGNSWVPALSGMWAYEKQNKSIWSLDITLVSIYITAAPGNVTKTTQR